MWFFFTVGIVCFVAAGVLVAVSVRKGSFYTILIGPLAGLAVMSCMLGANIQAQESGCPQYESYNGLSKRTHYSTIASKKDGNIVYVLVRIVNVGSAQPIRCVWGTEDFPSTFMLSGGKIVSIGAK